MPRSKTSLSCDRSESVWRSKCCGADLRPHEGGEGTRWTTCSECKRPCDGILVGYVPTDSDDADGYELDCTHCGREGLCWDGSDPLGDCPDEPHPCHACGGSGNRRDQVIF